MSKICVIGAGAAGLMAAGTAAQNGHKVFLYEKNKIVGKKLLITGKGRCNVLSMSDNEALMSNVVSNSKFLYSAFSSLNAKDLYGFFEEQGVPLKVERGQRVFPKSDKSHDIVKALKDFCLKNNVKIIYKGISEIRSENGKITGIVDSENEFSAFDKIILCTGGVSYPLTGSTGDGFSLAKKLGHTVTPLKGSLVPLETKETFVKELMGLSLKNVAVSLLDKEKGKTVFSDFGEMLFTHFGVSGPIILSTSAHIKDFNPNKYALKIDLKPALTPEQLDARIQRDFLKYINREIKNSLNELLPQKLIPVMIGLCEIPPLTKVNEITKEQRAKLVNNIKGLPLNIKGFRPIEEAIITSGGIKVSEINPKTMGSKLVEGLYFAGEMIDVDAYTGGFNLQIAFSTGFLAGKSV